MALTKILEPQDLHPAYNDVTVIMDSDNKNISGFNYVMDLFRVTGAGQRERIIRRRVRPRAVDGYGVFEVSRILQNYLTLNEPFNTSNYSPIDSYIRWEMDIYEEYVTNEYFSIAIAEDGINVQIFFGGSVPTSTVFNTGDFINIKPTQDTPIVNFFLNTIFNVLNVTSNSITVNINYDNLLADADVIQYIDDNGALELTVQPILGFNVEPIEDSLFVIEDKTAYNGSEPNTLFIVPQYNSIYPDSITFDPQTDYFLPRFYNPIKYTLMESNLDFNIENSNIVDLYPAGYALTTLRPVQEVTNDFFNIEYNNQIKIRRGQSIGLNWYNDFNTDNVNILMTTYDATGTLIERRKKTLQTNLFPIMRTNVGYWTGINSQFVSGTDSGGSIDGINFMEDDDIAYYAVWVEGVNADKEVINKSQPYIFHLDREEFDYEEYLVYFLDRLGSVQSFSFVNKHKVSFKVTREQSGQVIGRYFEKQGNNQFGFWGTTDNESTRRTFNINQEEELELTKAWMNDEESRLFEDFLTSPIHYIRQVPKEEDYTAYSLSKIEPYTIAMNSFDRKRLFQDDNNEYTIKFKRDRNEKINW